MSRKGIFSVISIVFLLVISSVVFAACNNDKAAFELKIYVNNDDLQPGDFVTVTATLRNRSFGLYHMELYPSKIALTVHPANQNVFYHLISTKYWIIPFQTITITRTIQISNTGYYLISAFCPITIGENHFFLSESVELLV